MMQVSKDGPLDGVTNMLRDSQLLTLAESGVSSLRFYSWDGPWVSLGRFQTPERDLIDRTLVPLALRPTGGKAVLHGHDLTVAVAMPLSDSKRSTKSVYRTLISPFTRALNRLGRPAELGENTPFVTPDLRSADCFRHISPNDVINPNTGKKLIGCALRITRTGVLAQCSIPLSLPLIDPARIYENAHVAIPLQVGSGELQEAIEESFTCLAVQR